MLHRGVAGRVGRCAAQGRGKSSGKVCCTGVWQVEWEGVLHRGVAGRVGRCAAQGCVTVAHYTQGLRNDFQDAMEKIDQEYLDDLAKVCRL